MDDQGERTGNTTRMTLIARLGDQADQAAWDRFVDQYTPLIFNWCRRFQLQDSDAADITQEVLLKLVGLMQDHAYDPGRGGFRAWLKTITSNLARDLLKSAHRRQTTNSEWTAGQRLTDIVDSDNVDSLARLIEEQYDRELFELASKNVRQRVQPRTWDCYFQAAVDQQSATDVANRLKIPVGEVYVHKSRVIRMLRDEVRRLDSANL